MVSIISTPGCKESTYRCAILCQLGFRNLTFTRHCAEFKEFEPWLKSAKIRFKLSAGLNLETFDTILSETNHNSAVV